MGKLSEEFKKTLEDGSVVVILKDAWGAWFVRKNDDPAFDPHPMGAFKTKAQAEEWADEKFSAEELDWVAA